MKNTTTKRRYLYCYSNDAVWFFCFRIETREHTTCRALAWSMKLEGEELDYAEALAKGLLEEAA